MCCWKGDLAQSKWNEIVENNLSEEQSTLLESLKNPQISKIEYPEFEAGSGVAIVIVMEKF